MKITTEGKLISSFFSLPLHCVGASSLHPPLRTQRPCENFFSIFTPMVTVTFFIYKWERSATALVKRFRVDARYSANLFSEIEGAERKRQGHLIEGRLEEETSKESAPSRGNGTHRLTGFFTIQVVNADDLKAVMKNIRSIPGILGIQLLNSRQLDTPRLYHVRLSPVFWNFFQYIF